MRRSRASIQKHVIVFFLLTLPLGILAGCGSSSPSAPGNPTLNSITVTPTTPSIAVKASLQLTAIGNYSNGSSKSLTASVVWSSSAPGVATISNIGLVTAVSVGSSTITATLSSINGTAPLTVTLVAPGTLPLGTASLIGATSCPPNAAAGASCTDVKVACPGLSDINVTVAVAVPSGTPKGTVTFHSGGSGTQLLNSGFPDAYVKDGFNVVQVAWASEWSSSSGIGIKTAACRPATLFQYIFTTVHSSSRSTGFCGQGISGGGAALTYSLGNYGLGDYFDHIVVASGPAVARLDYGCDSALNKAGPPNLCPLLTSAIYAYSASVAKHINDLEGTTSCGSSNPLQSDINRWSADSIVNADANFSLPKTSMSWFECVTLPVNESTGQAKFLIDAVVPKNAPPDVNCYSGVCTNEGVWQDTQAFNDTEAGMLAKCIPNHK